MDRMSRSQMLMDMAIVTAMRGTCSRLQVGAVFSKDGRIIVNGYNGVPKGRPHCKHECTCLFLDVKEEKEYPTGHFPGCPYFEPCLIAQHAERNAIDFAAKHGLSLEGSTLHVTHMPCEQCAGSLLNVGVALVIYLQPYRLTAGVELLEQAGIQVLRMQNKGLISSLL
jgi:dCMP deaminase